MTCKQLDNNRAQELRAKVVNVIKSARLPPSNINKGERKVLDDLRKDNNILVLLSDKGRCSAVVDREVYEGKVKSLLSDTNTYTKLSKDPTNNFQRDLIDILKRLKEDKVIDDFLYRKLYPTARSIPVFYGLPKIHKGINWPLRPIVASIGSVSHQVARFIADMLSPLVGTSPHHIKNTQDFVSKIKHLSVDGNKTLISNDVSALFTSIPVDKALEVVENLIKSQDCWKNKTYLNADQVLSLLGFCLRTTYFTFRGDLYQQDEGCAMGSSVFPIIANFYNLYFEQLAITSAPTPPSVWYRYVDDTFVKIRKDAVDDFTYYINSLDPHIKFTSELEKEGQLAFLDSLVTRRDDGTIKVAICRKATLTDQYLDFHSHHPLEH